MDNEIIITEENKEMYQQFCDIQNHITIVNHPVIFSIITSIVVLFLGTSTVFAIVPWISFIKNIFLMINPAIEGINIPIIITGIFSYIGLILGISSSILPIQKKIRFNTFKKKYPDFDTTVDAKKIMNLLKEYQHSKQKQNMLKNPIMDTRKLDSDTKLEKINLFEMMTLEEKLAYLEKEREFWMDELNKDNSYEKPFPKHIN